MAERKASSVPPDKLALYERLLVSVPGVEGKANFGAGYTALNGNMYTMISKHGVVGIRPARARPNGVPRGAPHGAVPRRSGMAAGEGVRRGAGCAARRHRGAASHARAQPGLRADAQAEGDEARLTAAPQAGRAPAAWSASHSSRVIAYSTSPCSSPGMRYRPVREERPHEAQPGLLHHAARARVHGHRRRVDPPRRAPGTRDR